MTIELLKTERQSDVSKILTDMFQTRRETKNPVPQLVSHILELWNSSEIEILGKFNPSNNLQGIVILSLASNRLSFIHITNSENRLDQEQVQNYERELFDAGFTRLKENESWVTSGGSSWLSDNLIEHAIELGFKKYENIGMSVSRSKLEDLRVPSIPDGYSLENYHDKWRSKISHLFFDCLKGSIECNAEPDVLSTPERCENLVHETVNNHWGDFRDGQYSWILKHNEELVGASLFTIMNKNTGFGVGICLTQDYRGMGLGRTLFIHSLASILDSEPDVKVFSHATSAMNIALPLYESLGFQEISRHSIYTWLSDE